MPILVDIVGDNYLIPVDRELSIVAQLGMPFLGLHGSGLQNQSLSNMKYHILNSNTF